MNNKKAEEEISTLMTISMLVGVATPAALVWGAAKIDSAVNYLVTLGVLERSSRVVVSLNGEIGLDLGRISILIGITILICVIIKASIMKIVKHSE